MHQRRTRVRRIVVAIVAIGAAGACGGETSQESSGPITLDSLPERYGAALCEVIAPCCQGFDVPFSATTCRQSFRGLYEELLSTARRELFTYDAAAAGACLDTVRVADDTCGALGNADSALVCDEVFTGTLEPGEECRADIECARPNDGTVECDEDDEAVSRCIQSLRSALGEPCNWTCTEEGGSRFCSGSGDPPEPFIEGRCYTNDGLYCASDGRCASQTGLGEVCDDSDACTSGTWCDFQTGVCAEPRGEGESCFGDDSCQSGLYCGDSSTCTPRRANGSPCDYSFECLGSCVDGVCDGESGGIEDLAAALLCSLSLGASFGSP